MSDNVLKTIRAKVQDFLAPELKTQGVRLDSIERRLDDAKHGLEQRIDDSKDLLRAEIRASESKLEARLATIDGRMATLEGMIQSLIQQITFESGLRERVASHEARMPEQ